MITKNDLISLQEYKAATGRVLSVYLDIDQSKAANLNRGFKLAFESKIQNIDKSFDEDYEQRDFAACATEVRRLLAKYESGGRGLIIFAKSSGSIWIRELNVPVTTDVRWGSTVYLQPFVEALDEFETYAVVVADRTRARIFTVKLGIIEQHSEIHALAATRHIRTTGTDHLYSQSHFQRKADQHSLTHLKRVVELIEHLARFKPFDRMVLAGNHEATSELFRLLPKSLRGYVVGSVVLAANAPEKEILETTLAVERKAERAREMGKVETLLTSSAKGAKAVATLPETLKALNENRVRELIYTQGFAAAGGTCKECSAIFMSDRMNCEFCGKPVQPAEDLMEFAVTMALADAATIEQVRGEAAEKLKAAGGIGAFLRF